MSESLARLRAWAARQPSPGVLQGGAALLALCYTWAYLTYPEAPGRRPGFPEGWWSWVDQSRTMRSAAALAHGDLAASQHWYPLGYALLGAPFVARLQAHAFFFVDLAALLLAFAAFCRFARHAGIAVPWAAAVFLGATLADRQIFDQWVIPWNTSPAAALTWLLLALASGRAALGPTQSSATSAWRWTRALAIGVVAGCIPLFRPTDSVLVAACCGAALAADLLRVRHPPWRMILREWSCVAAGAAVPLTAYGVLHLAIYGPHESEYMRESRGVGFTWYDLPWKAYVILLDPRPWFGEGDGLLRRCPWLALSLAGLLPAWRRRAPDGRRPLRVLAIMLAAHAVLYLSYVDLLPTGLWRYDLVHYWIWALPGDGLLAFVLLRDLIRPAPGCAIATRGVAAASLAATALLLCVHLDPVEVSAASPAKMLLFPGVTAPFTAVYFDPVVLRDGGGDLENTIGMRLFPAADGLRVIALRRPFRGSIVWPTGQALPWAGSASSGTLTRWGIAARLGWPCWLVPRACRSTGVAPRP